MKRFPCRFAFLILFAIFGFIGTALAEDVVYLKDGSVIHGTITEEVPGKTIKIETNDGNIFVYKVKAIDKITHSKPDAGSAATPTDSQAGQALPAASPNFTPTIHLDPHARFSKFGFLVNARAFGRPVFTMMSTRTSISCRLGSSYEFVPGWAHAGLGLGWFTNNLGLKWTFRHFPIKKMMPAPIGTARIRRLPPRAPPPRPIIFSSPGTELEADLSMDSITNADNVTASFYIPLIVGWWDVDLNTWTVYDWTNYTTDFGSGIGIRGFDSSKFMWDFQIVYRACTRGNYLLYNSEPGSELYSVNTGRVFGCQCQRS